LRKGERETELSTTKDYGIIVKKMQPHGILIEEKKKRGTRPIQLHQGRKNGRTGQLSKQTALPEKTSKTRSDSEEKSNFAAG